MSKKLLICSHCYVVDRKIVKCLCGVGVHIYTTIAVYVNTYKVCRTTKIKKGSTFVAWQSLFSFFCDGNATCLSTEVLMSDRQKDPVSCKQASERLIVGNKWAG
jgi:hypothetical protein